ncbi:MAG: hypothetical protein CMP30_06660, partial [Roseibacillus sp.]|nr:hypothetical protein [Roseibacillus sp.]
TTKSATTTESAITTESATTRKSAITTESATTTKGAITTKSATTAESAITTKSATTTESAITTEGATTTKSATTTKGTITTKSAITTIAKRANYIGSLSSLRDASPNLNVVCDVSRRKKDLTVARKELGQHHVVPLSPAEEGGSVSRPLETGRRVSRLFFWILDSTTHL